MEYNINRRILILSILLYFLGLVYFLFFRFGIPYFFNNAMHAIDNGVKQTFYLIPFKSMFNPELPVLYSIIINLINIIVFIPLCLGLLFLFKKRVYLKTFITFIVIAFILEILQNVTQLGSYDITDIMFYCLGYCISVFIYIKFKDKANYDIVNKVLYYLIIISIPILLFITGLEIYQVIRLFRY